MLIFSAVLLIFSAVLLIFSAVLLIFSAVLLIFSAVLLIFSAVLLIFSAVSSVGRDRPARNGPVRVQDILSQSIASNVESRAQVRSSQEGSYPPSRSHTRDRRLEGAEAGTGIAIDVRLPRTCRGPLEARVGEGSRSITETSHQCRSRTVPQIHRQGGEEGGRARCGARSRGQCLE